jgi:hypothetical protein
MKLGRLLGVIAMAALAVACSREPRTEAQPPVASEYWSVATPPVEDPAPPVLQYIDAATIDDDSGARRATTIALMALPPDLSRFSVRLHIVNEFACDRRQVRPISTTITPRDGAPMTNPENQAWVDVDGLENMAAPFDFVCGDATTRASDPRFARVTDARPLETIADESLAANAQAAETASD